MLSRPIGVIQHQNYRWSLRQATCWFSSLRIKQSEAEAFICSGQHWVFQFWGMDVDFFGNRQPIGSVYERVGSAHVICSSSNRIPKSKTSHILQTYRWDCCFDLFSTMII
jgi:hypothetical protein